MSNYIIRSIKYIAELSTIFRLGNTQVLTLKERETLLALKAETDRIQGEINRFSVDRPSEIREEAVMACSANPSQENIDALEKVNVDMESLRSHCSLMRLVLNEGLKTFCKDKVAPVVLPILERAAKAAQKQYEVLEASEKASAEAYGVPFAPSQTLDGIHGAARNLNAKIQTIHSNDFEKSQCLPDLALSLDPKG